MIHSTLLKQIENRLAVNRKHSFDNALQQVDGIAVLGDRRNERLVCLNKAFKICSIKLTRKH